MNVLKVIIEVFNTLSYVYLLKSQNSKDECVMQTCRNIPHNTYGRSQRQHAKEIKTNILIISSSFHDSFIQERQK